MPSKELEKIRSRTSKLEQKVLRKARDPGTPSDYGPWEGASDSQYRGPSLLERVLLSFAYIKNMAAQTYSLSFAFAKGGTVLVDTLKTFLGFETLFFSDLVSLFKKANLLQTLNLSSLLALKLSRKFSESLSILPSLSLSPLKSVLETLLFTDLLSFPLKLLFLFNETSGTTVYDHSCNENDGTIYNANRVVGKFGRGLKFLGGGFKNSYVNVGNKSSLDFSYDSFSITFWVKGENIATYAGMVGKNELSTSYGYAIYREGYSTDLAKYLRWRLKGSDFFKAFTHTDLIVFDNKWHFVVWIVDRENDVSYIYVDGQKSSEVDISDVGDLSNTGDFGLSIWDWSFDGYLAEVRVYNKVLTQTEVQTMYNEEKEKYEPFKEPISILDIISKRISIPKNESILFSDSISFPLVLLLEFNETSGSTVYDTSSFSNDGTLYNIDRAVGTFGRAIFFPGVSNVVIMSYSDSLWTPDSFTFMCWVKSYISQNPSHTFICVWHSGSVSNRWELSFHNGSDLTFYMDNGTTYSMVQIPNIITKGKWHFVCVVFKADERQEIWVDGQLVAQTTPFFSGGLGSTDRDFRLGEIGWWGSDNIHFYGIMDDVKIYERDFSQSEIQALYNLTKGKYEPFKEGVSFSDQVTLTLNPP